MQDTASSDFSGRVEVSTCVNEEISISATPQSEYDLVDDIPFADTAEIDFRAMSIYRQHFLIDVDIREGEYR